MAFECAPGFKDPFDEATMFQRVQTVGVPFHLTDDISADERRRMIDAFTRYVRLTDDEKHYIVFGKDDPGDYFMRSSQVGVRKRGVVTDKEAILRRSRFLASGTVFHEMIADAFFYFAENGIDVEGMQKNIRDKYQGTFTVVPPAKNDTESVEIKVTYSARAIDDVFKYINYLLTDIRNRVEAAGYKIEQVDFYPEQVTANFDKNVAGSQDLLVVTPNNRGWVYDHKSSLRIDRKSRSGAGARNRAAKHNRQIQHYMTGNRNMGVKTVGGYIMPVLQIPDFDPYKAENEIHITKIYSPAEDTRKPQPETFQPLAVNTSVTSDPNMSAAVKSLSQVISKMGKIGMDIDPERPGHIPVQAWDSIVEDLQDWKRGFRLRLDKYKEMYQAITLQYDFAAIISLFTLIKDEVKLLQLSKRDLLDRFVSEEGEETSKYMDNIHEIQQLLRALSSIKLELEGIHSFFKVDMIRSLDLLAENWRNSMMQNALGNFFNNLFDSPLLENQAAPVITLYYNPENNNIQIPEGASPEEIALSLPWSATPREGGKDRRYNIILDKRILNTNPGASRPGFFNKFEADGNPVYELNTTTLTSSAFFTYLMDPQSQVWGVPGETPYMHAEQRYETPGTTLPFTPIDPGVFAQSLVNAMQSYFERGHDKFTEYMADIDRSVEDLVIVGISKNYLDDPDNPEKSKVTFRPMTTLEAWGTSAELINHPVYQLRTELFYHIDHKVNMQARETMVNFNKVMKNFMRWAKNNGLSDKEAQRKLANTQYGHFHEKYTEEFHSRVDDARINKNAAFFFKYFQVDTEAHKKWFDERYEVMALKYQDDVTSTRLDNWENRNSFERYEDGSFSEGWTSPSVFRFLSVKPEHFEEVMTDEFKYIMANEPLLDVYNTFLELTKEAKRIIGDNIANIPADEAFLPIFEAEFSEMLRNGPRTVKGMIGQFADAVMSGARVSPVDPVVGFSKQGDLANVEVPFQGFYPLVNSTAGTLEGLTDQEREKNARLMSFDFAAVGTRFIYSMYTYEQLKLSEPVAMSLLAFMQSERYEETARVLGTTLKSGGEDITTKGKDKNQTRKFTERFERWIYYDLYGIRYLDRKREDDDSVMVPEKVGSGRGPITWKSFMMFARNLYSRNVLGLAFIPSMAALVAGITNGYVNSTERLLFAPDGFRRGLKNMWGSATRARTREIGKYFNVYNTPVDHMISMEKKQFKNKLLSDWYMYGPLRTVDTWITDVILHAVTEYWGIDRYGNLKEMKVLEADESEKNPVPLKDYFVYDEETDQLIIKDGDKLTEHVVGQLRGIMTQATRDAYGQLPENQKIGLQFYFSSTMALTFSSWVPGIVNKRFGPTTYDPKLDKITIARYRGVTQAFGTRDAARWSMKNLLGVIGDSLRFIVALAPFTPIPSFNQERVQRKIDDWVHAHPEEAKAASAGAATKEEAEQMIYTKYTEAIERAVRSMVIELRFVIMVYMAAYALRLDYDDDDEPLYKEYYPTRQLFKILAKTHTELVFLLNPAEISRFLNQPIPAFGIFKDAIRVIENTSDETIDFITGRTDSRDQSPPMYYSSRFLMMNQLRKVLEIYEQDKENPYW